MATRQLLAIVALTVVLIGSRSHAHYHMLFPQSPATARDKPATLTLQFGHPFEHQLFDAAKPERIVVVAPDGKKTDLSKLLQPVSLPTADKKKVSAFQLAFTPEQRGDYTFVAVAAPIWMPDEQEFVQDTVKVVLHVQTQKGWDAGTGQEFELVSLTRPYGLQPGMVFQAQALFGGKPLGGAMVEVERFNPIAPKQLPDDEQITRRVKTDPNGIATCTLTEPGWWCFTAHRDAGKRARDGALYPLRQRATFWVFVDDKGR